MIDDVPTIIEHVRDSFAIGKMIMDDFSLEKCYIARVGDFFAHGKTLKEAVRDATIKHSENMPEEERIAAFVKEHPELHKPYPDLFVWHHILTGSCEAGRNAWCRSHGLKPTDSITVEAFITGTKDDYGGSIIRNLAKHYGMNLKSEQ